MPYGSKLYIPPTNDHLLAPQQETYKEAYLFKKIVSFLERSQENGPLQTNIKTERSRGLGRKTREEIGKGNQMTALRFQTGE